MSLKGILSWANPLTNEDTSPFDPSTIAGYELSFDGGPAIAIDVGAGAQTSYDMNALPEYKALKGGNHTAALDVFVKSGEKSAFSASATFRVALVPNAPTDLVVT